MPVIPDAEVAAMQAVERAYMPDLARVSRPSRVKNAAGGPTTTWVDAYTNLACQASPRVLRQLAVKIEGGRPESGIRWVIVFPAGTVIQNDDIVYVTEHGSGITKTFHVNGTQSPESWETAVSVEALLIA